MSEQARNSDDEDEDENFTFKMGEFGEYDDILILVEEVGKQRF